MSTAVRQRRTLRLFQQAASLLCLLFAVSSLACADEDGHHGNALSQSHSFGGMGLAGGAMLGGLKFEPKWSLNADAVDLGAGVPAAGELADSDSGLGVTGKGGMYALHGIRLSGTGTLPINQGLSLFGKVGLANLSRAGNNAGLFKSTTGPVDLSYSAGGQYNFSPGLSLHAEWDRYTLNQGDVDLFSAGIHYNFK